MPINITVPLTLRIDCLSGFVNRILSNGDFLSFCAKLFFFNVTRLL